ncbi:MAG: PorV/PorQ family protein [Elusimicrobia bacterium]|nr:PorV/PorQ family protein [Elusimicrobiota bacterium]
MDTLLTAVALAVLTASTAFSQIKTGADFLNIPVGARPVGMGNAYTALANDVTSLHWNPAGLALMNHRELGAMHSQWLLNTQYNFLGFGAPSSMGSIAGSVAVLSQGNEEGRGANREKTGTIKAQDQVFSLGFAKNLGELKGGINTKLISSQIAGFRAQSYALDMGMLYPVSSSLGFGAALQNLGPGMRFISQRDPLPLTLAAGVSYRFLHGLAVALDVKENLVSKKNQINLGTEYSVLPILTLRGGYLASLAGQRQVGGLGKNLNGLSAGLGFNFLGNRMDYAFTPFGLLGDTHRISLNVRF